MKSRRRGAVDTRFRGYEASRYFNVALNACENSSSVRSSRSGVTET
jgi:hypothetical protein